MEGLIQKLKVMIPELLEANRVRWYRGHLYAAFQCFRRMGKGLASPTLGSTNIFLQVLSALSA